MPEPRQFDFKKIIRWFSKDEVKTPLSFFFKVIPYLTASWIAILYAPISDSMKQTLFQFSAWILVGLCVLIAVFAFFRPRHLVYGEAGHRAERKIELGTETKTYSTEEFDKLDRGNNPKQLEQGDAQ
jgi:hypothetical protein